MRKRMKGGKVPKPARTRNYFAYGLPISLSLMLTYILSQGDLFFINHFMGAEAVGQYNAGYNLGEPLTRCFIYLDWHGRDAHRCDSA